MALAQTPPPGRPESPDVRRGAEVCRERGCASPATLRCEYVDSHGQPCGTRWCADHARGMGEHRYCRRHAATVTALGAKGGDPRALPSVGNRGVSLVSWIFTEGHSTLNAAVTARLRPGEVLFEDGAVNVSRHLGGARCWEQGWRVGNRDGIVRRVALRVDENDDTMVSVVDGHTVVGRHVPPWIPRQRGGDQVTAAAGASDRSRFYALLASSVRRALAGPGLAERGRGAEADAGAHLTPSGIARRRR